MAAVKLEMGQRMASMLDKRKRGHGGENHAGLGEQGVVEEWPETVAGPAEWFGIDASKLP